MVKKLALLFSVLLFIGSLFFFAQDTGGGGTAQSLTAGSLAGEVGQAKTLYKRLAKTLDASGVRLCFRGEELACDRESGVFYLPVDMDGTQWESGSFTDAGGELQILPLEDYTLLDKQETVASGRQVLFLAWSEERSACAEVKVVFTGLPVVRIETDADLDVDTVFAGSISFYQACGLEDWVFSSAFEAHERGQTTRAYPKKGYRVNLITVTSTGVVNKNKESVLGMRNSDSWIFYAIYSDGTKVRDKFNTELWNRFGAENTPYDAHFGTHMEYAELIVNGEYRGLYGVMEPIDSSQLGITDEEYLYKRTYGRELSTELFDGAKPEDYLTVLGMEIKGKSGSGTAADWECLRSFIEMTEQDDDTFAQQAAQLLDMDNMTDIWLYLQMLYGEDNIYKNMFFAFKKTQAGYRLYLVPWDMDLSWGNIYVDDREQLYVTNAPERASDYLEWPLADRLLALDAGGIREKAAERWEELRAGVLSEESMEELLEECIHQVQDSGAFSRDAQRWPDSSHDGDYAGLRRFLSERMDFLDKMIQQ
ncbi:MAG: CotH kinase family protein [Eubacteriales bacterium]|nr:CotH kinase family protein [Eubacteriales bacterium]